MLIPLQLTDRAAFALATTIGNSRNGSGRAHENC
jgi:hypothetical protein